MGSKRSNAGQLEGVNLLELAPVRLAEWIENDAGRAVVTRPRPRSKGLRGALDYVAFLMSTKLIRLDEVGTFAWKHLDGRATVREVAEELRREFGEAAEPVEERLGFLVKLLRREELIGYPGWDELPASAAGTRGENVGLG